MNTTSPVNPALVQHRENVVRFIRARRLNRGLSLMDLARLTGLSLGTIALSSRSGIVTARTAAVLGPVLGVAPQALVAPREVEEE